MANKRFYKHRFAYAGKRLSSSGKKVYSAFAVGPNFDGDLKAYSLRRDTFIIGSIYEGKMTRDGTVDFATFKDTGETVPADLIERWSAQDAASRRAKQTESARTRLQKERRSDWLTRLEPLRREYRQMTFAQRAAIRQLLLEWLDE